MLHTASLEDDLVAVVGARQVLRDPQLRGPYETDWTGRYSASAALVVRPGSADEVAAVMAVCHAHGAAVVPQGGNTGLVGGGVPRGGEVVLSLSRLTRVCEPDVRTGQIEAGAGATLAAVAARAHDAGFDLGIDFAARDSATVGGLAATDAGGTRAVRHGTMRARVVGVQAVLADGALVDRRSGVLKDNAGYDLSALLIGSEGTLGVLTAVRMALVPRLDSRVAALVPVASVEEAAELLGALRRDVPSLDAVELILDDGLQLVLDHLGLPAPVPRRAAVYVLLECAARTDPTQELADALSDREAVVADDTSARARLWRLREAHTEAIAARGIPHKLDVGVPLSQLPRFVREVPETVASIAPDARTVLFGHLGDGNVHVNVLGLPVDEERVDEAVLELAARCEGTISAEHGIGVAKSRWLGLTRDSRDVEAMRSIKRALDPAGILNPGVIFEPEPNR